MTTKEMYEQILNKQFEKSVFTGYSTEDVDRFFDFVIEYLKQNELDTLQYIKINEALKKENAQKQIDIEKCLNKIATLTAELNQYKADGYGNVIANKRKQEELNKKGEKK